MIINNIEYKIKEHGVSKLVTDVTPKEGQTFEVETQLEINAKTYELSSRNGSGVYILPLEKDKVWLNFIAEKIIITDSELEKLGNEFEYFIDDLDDLEVIEEDILVADGQFFRCVGSGTTLKKKEDMTYYILLGGKARKIPNYKTLEVMLAERNQTLNSVRVLEKDQCDIIPDGEDMPDRASQWKKEHEDQTNLEKLKELENNAKEAGEMMEEAKGEANKQIEAVKEQAAAAKAEAEAAKAEAKAAEAAAAAAQAEAEAKKAEYEAQINSGT